MQQYQRAVMGMDIMFINKLPFLVTITRGLPFGTIEFLENRQVPTVQNALTKVLRVYRHRGFRMEMINADPEFEPLQEKFGCFNFCAQGEHVPEVEQYI
jgi:hypothetical protein